jgi:hypothetical protein
MFSVNYKKFSEVTLEVGPSYPPSAIDKLTPEMLWTEHVKSKLMKELDKIVSST